MQQLTAQTSQIKTKPQRDSIIDDNRMDVFDVVRKVLKKPKLFLPKPGSRGPFIVTIPYPGYTIATGVAGVLPINFSFYTSRDSDEELSFFNNNFQYTQYKQIIAQSLSNIYLTRRWELIGDWRYYNFPTVTYGLGSGTLFSDADKINFSQLRIYELMMRRLGNGISVGIGYHLDYHWDIRDENAAAGMQTDFLRYGLTRSSASSGLSANFLYDTRNNANNPKRGTFFLFQFRSNLTGLGGNNNWNSIIIDLRKYFRLPSAWPMTFALWGYISITTNGKPPYLDLPSTGSDFYNNSGRGYALGRYRGLNMVYFEMEYRYAILRNGLLGGVVFANMQGVSEWPGNDIQQFQPGIGLGLRVKLNKTTNTNSAIDYGFGTGGSRGFAFNFNEVF